MAQTDALLTGPVCACRKGRVSRAKSSIRKKGFGVTEKISIFWVKINDVNANLPYLLLSAFMQAVFKCVCKNIPK